MTKLGGFVGAILLIAVLLYVGDRIDFTADVTNDFVATAIITAVGVIGWLVGAQTVRRLTHHGHRHTAK